MAYNYGGYDPLQSRREDLLNRKNMIEQQLQSLQQLNVPPININNNMPMPTQPPIYDGNFKWVDNEQQAREVANNNLPLILFDNNEDKFYMKNIDGSFKCFHFEEVQSQQLQNNPLEDRMNSLESKLSDILDYLKPQTQVVDTTKPSQDKSSKQGSKSQKGGN